MMCFAISPNKANRLYWLGRYTERVYTSLHILRKCYDQMIDGNADGYINYYNTMNINSMYDDIPEFTSGLMYDKNNPASLISSLEAANDNAILLREEIMSETLSYIQMSRVRINNAAEKTESNITNLQPVTDYLLAFWGSVDERIFDERIRNFLEAGRLIEYIDMHIRFDYNFFRVSEAFDKLCKCSKIEEGMFDSTKMIKIESMLTADSYDPKDVTYKYTLLKYLNELITV